MSAPASLGIELSATLAPLPEDGDAVAWDVTQAKLSAVNATPLQKERKEFIIPINSPYIKIRLLREPSLYPSRNMTVKKKVSPSNDP
jgi:hypothetical protein